MNMAKDVTFSPLEDLKKGVDIIANAVKATLGPRGRNVIMRTNYKKPHVTKDGVTVAKEINLKHPVQDLAVQLVKEAADKTAQLAGDGTTTATVFTQALFNEGYKYLQAGVSPSSLKEGIEYGLLIAQNIIEKDALKLNLANEEDQKKIYQISALSANNDKEIGDLVAQASLQAGLDGVVAVEDSNTMESYVTHTEGYSYDRGFLSPHFVTDTLKNEVVYENPYILIYNGKIRDINDMAAVAEEVATNGGRRPLLIIADEVEAQALQFLVVNKVRGGFPFVAVKAPSFGDRRRQMLEDLAVATNGILISDDIGVHIKEVTIDYLGSADKIVVTPHSTTIINGHGAPEEVLARVMQIKEEKASAQYDWEVQQIQERLAKLAGGVSVIKVGAATEAELKEKKDRIDDALNAARAAMKQGILPGGGIMYLKIHDHILEKNLITEINSDAKFGLQCFLNSLKAPFYTICENAGTSGDRWRGKIDYDKWEVYNAKDNTIENAMTSGILDPALVCEVALRNAVSIANLLLSTAVTITNDEDEIDQSIPQMSPL
jgi:chaperonin GroEL